MQHLSDRAPQSAPRPPISLASTWDLVAEDYAVEVAPTLASYAAQALSLARSARGAAPLSQVVDVATGPGTLALLAAEQGLRVDALDFAPRMIAALSAEVARRGLKGVTPLVGDGMALAYADATFDAGFSLAKQTAGDGFAAIEEQLVMSVSAQFGAGAQQVDMPAILTVGIRS